MYELHVESDFAAAHCLRGYQGKCERLHGHNWRVQVVLRSEALNALGMVMDFKDARAALGEVLERFDHRHLNETAPYDRINPTTENLARGIAEEVGGRLPEGVKVKSVTVWESERCGATWRYDER